MTYSQSWLENPSSIRGILVELTVKDVVANSEVSIYLSNMGYVTADGSVTFLPYISGGVQFTESLPVDGQPTLSFGDIAINNAAGQLDVWLDSTKYIWVNRNIQVYIGDPSWVCQNITEVRTRFEKIFDGVVADVDSKDRNTLNIKVRDKLEKLNTPLSDAKIGTYGAWAAGQTNTDTLKPLVFGEVFNIQPVLVNPAQLEYMFCKDSSELVIELRDNGVPIYTHNGTTAVLSTGATVTLATGTFKLTTNLVGTLTASVQGVKNSVNLSTGALVSGTYVNNIANLIALITTQYGVNKLTAAELDLVNLSAFAAANTQSVGTYVTDTTSVIGLCQELANSIGAQLFMTRKGLLQLLRIGVPTTDPVVAITTSDILNQSLVVSNRTTVSASATLGFCKNWTTQSNLLSNIYPEDKENFTTDVYSRTSLDNTVQTNYKLSANSVSQKDTLLLKGTEAQAEANRLNAYYKVPRTIYSFTGTAKLMSLKLGQGVTLTHPRFNLSGTVSGQVVSLSPDWLNSTIAVEVII